MSREFVARHGLGEPYRLDGSELVVRTQAVCFRDTRMPTYEVTYIHNGVSYEIWVEEDRLS